MKRGAAEFAYLHHPVGTGNDAEERAAYGVVDQRHSKVQYNAYGHSSKVQPNPAPRVQCDLAGQGHFEALKYLKIRGKHQRGEHGRPKHTDICAGLAAAG